MPVTGDFGKLEAFEKLLDSGDAMLPPMSRAMAEEVIDLTKQRFREERDPYGQPWAPKKRPDGRKVLSGPTSRLKGGWHVKEADGGGFTIAPSVAYAAPHQAPRRSPITGLLRRQRRRMVPDAAQGLPESYAEALEEVALEAFKQWFRTATGGGGGGGRANFVARKIAAARRRLNIRQIIRRATHLGGSDHED